MNVELYEGQKGRIRITLNGEFEVYGGTTKGRFVSGRYGDDYILIIPAQYNTSCYDPRFSIFARRESTGQEWLVESGRIALKQRHSLAHEDAISSKEYHITKELLESGETVESKPMVIGIKGDRGYSAYEIAVQNGYVGTEQEFTNMMVLIRTYHDEAAESQRQSADSAGSAANSAGIATNAANTATAKAGVATSQAATATAQAETATLKASEATKAASDAAVSKSAAGGYATDANASKKLAQESADIAEQAKKRAMDAEILSETNVIRLLKEGQTFLDAAYDAKIESEIHAIVALKAAQDAAESVLTTI